MGNRCSFCEEKTDTDILILNDNDWLEFCPPCGEKQKVTNKITGEQLRLVDYYARMWEQNFQEGGKNG